MPYFYYLRYLITLCLEPIEIIKRMKKLQFDISRDEIEKMSRGMMLPLIFKKFKEKKKVDQKYLIKYARKFGIEKMWNYKLNGKPRYIKQTLGLIKNPNRIIPVILNIKGADVYDDMEKLGFEYSKNSITAMLYYFYNNEKVSTEGWRIFFKGTSLEKLIDKPINFVRYKLGLKPKIEYNTVLQDLMQLSYYKSQEILEYNTVTKDDIMIANKLANIAIKAGANLEKYGTKSETEFLEDIEFAFESADIKPKIIDEIDDDELI